MPFQRPTPQQIRDRIAVELEAELPGAEASLRRSVEGVIMRMMAMASYELHGHLDWISRQILVDTAEAEILDRHAGIWGIGRLAPTKASGTAKVTGEDGAVVPDGAALTDREGTGYTVTAEATVNAGEASAAIEAVEPGAAGNLNAGATLVFSEPVAGLASSASVEADGQGGGLTGGTDPESDEALRRRVIKRIQEPPHGGADFDYEAWALEVAGVTRVWVFPLHLGAGTVGVTFARDNDDGGFIPDAAQVQEVQDRIDAVRPVTAEVTVFAPVAKPLDLTLSITPDEAAVRAAIEAELKDFIRRDGAPGVTLRRSRLIEAISLAAGETYHSLTDPAGDVAHQPAEIPVLGTITWA